MLEVLEIAKKLFEEKRLHECVSQLEKIEEKNQLALMHNILLCKYFLCSNESPFTFVEKLINLLKNTPKGNEIVTLPIRYNLAVMLFQCRQYMAAMSLLSPHVKNIEENQNYPDITSRICLLLFCIYMKISDDEHLQILYESFSQPPMKHILTLCSSNMRNTFHLQINLLVLSQDEKDLNKLKQNINYPPEQCNIFELFQAHVEYNQQHYKEAITLLENGANLNPSHPLMFLCVSRDTFYNNIGCSYYRMANQPQALRYYTKALNCGVSQLSSLIPKHLEGLISKNFGGLPPTSSTTIGYFSAVSGFRRPEILANCGITLLRLGYPHYAFYCFKVLFLCFNNNCLGGIISIS
jgi:tetratricopeptide (TPR) repeat protein